MRHPALRQIRMVAGLVLCAVACGSCGDASRQDRAPVYLVIDSLTAASGADPNKFANVLASDVITIVKVNSVLVPTVFEDPGRVALRLQLKDIGNAIGAAEPSGLNDVTITSYRVVFSRADGRNTPGVDVPYGFDGAITGTISSGSASELGFTLVRAQAKEEAPLKALQAGGGALLISTIATVTFYGRDLAGNDVSVTGQISVNFADWGDPR